MKKLFPLIFLFVLVGCAAPTPVVVTNTEIVSQIATQLVTVEVTRQVEVIKEIIVTATYSGPTPTPEPTADDTKTNKVDGSYMVGSDIAPGIWQSVSGLPDEECWLRVETFSGDLEGITGELPGATIRIPDGQYMVYIGGGYGNKCTWSYLMP